MVGSWKAGGLERVGLQAMYSHVEEVHAVFEVSCEMRNMFARYTLFGVEWPQYLSVNNCEGR